MDIGISIAQTWVAYLLSLGSLVAQVFALADAIRQPGLSYVAAGKRTKPIWLVILGVSLAVGFLHFPRNPLSFFNVIAVVAAVLYIVDVRPALRQLRGGSSNRSSSDGPW